jgi:protein subunit release factor B
MICGRRFSARLAARLFGKAPEAGSEGPAKRVEVQLRPEELAWKMVKGGGPGGQATNKTSNCALLTHLPTGIQVKCHQSRDAETNKHYALRTLKERLDVLQNGALSKKAVRDEKERRNKERNKRRSVSKHARPGETDPLHPGELG